VQIGSPSATEVLSVNDAQPILYPSVSAVFQDLIAGYIDAAIVDQPLALRYVRIPANNLKVVGKPFGGEDYAIALCSQRNDLVRQINDGLSAIETDGTLDKLQQKWFGSR
jgi:ABC-type amino acid transport substrate-binding protein